MWVKAWRYSGWGLFALGATAVLIAMLVAFAKLVKKYKSKSLTEVKLTRGKLAVLGLIGILWLVEYFAVWKYWPAMLAGSSTGVTAMIVLVGPLLVIITFLEQLWGETL